jgi:hypothetical protein
MGTNMNDTGLIASIEHSTGFILSVAWVLSATGDWFPGRDGINSVLQPSLN